MSFCKLDKGDYPENSQVVFGHNKLRSFEPFVCFDPSYPPFLNNFREVHGTAPCLIGHTSGTTSCATWNKNVHRERTRGTVPLAAAVVKDKVN